MSLINCIGIVLLFLSLFVIILGISVKDEYREQLRKIALVLIFLNCAYLIIYLIIKGI
jgi:hypothetical protein